MKLTTDPVLWAKVLAARPPKVPWPEGAKRASVAVILVPDAVGAPELMMIERAHDPRDPWSGQMAFPGGRVDPGDVDDLAAAVRETDEEVGVTLNPGLYQGGVQEPAGCLGRLTPIVTPRHFKQALVVNPFVWTVASRPEVTPNYEVASVVWAPLSTFADPESRTTMLWKRNPDHIGITLPCVFIGPHRVWGMSLGMIDDLIRRLRADGRDKPDAV